MTTSNRCDFVWRRAPGEWVRCIQEGEVEVEDGYWLCEEHHDDQRRSEEADLAVKRIKEG